MHSFLRSNQLLSAYSLSLLSFSSYVIGREEFHGYVQGADAFHLFQPLLQAADVQDVSFFDGKCVFPWDDDAVFAVDDFMQPAGLDVEKEFSVFHILLGNHDAAGHVSFVQQFRIQVFYQPVDG